MTFPNVPSVPGVPSLPRAPGTTGSTIELLITDALSILGIFLGPEWGLFRSSGQPVVVADSVNSFDYKQDWTVSTFPIEPNAFASYDKVETPFNIRIKFASGGSEFERRSLIASIEAIAGTLELFDAVTPEKIYTSVNVMHYDYDRTALRGAGLLIVDVWCIQVRVTGDVAFTSSTSSTTGGAAGNTKDPSGASAVSGGTVQPQDVTITPDTIH